MKVEDIDEEIEIGVIFADYYSSNNVKDIRYMWIIGLKV
jgi:hypothetical protein